MATTNKVVGNRLYDAIGNWIGMLGLGGQENTVPNQAAIAITGGTINGASIGVTTPAVVKTSNMQAVYTDSSGTPGNVTNNSPRGKVAIAAGQSQIVVTNSLVTATSSVFCQMRTADATCTQLLTCVVAAGSFTVTGNAVSTAQVNFDYFVVN